jgi:glycosyltransferase involved in cell wall biosynthesis
MNPYLRLPEAIGRETLPPDRRPRVMTPVWGSLPTSFSQITWHLAKAAIDHDLLEAAFVLETKRNVPLRVSGALWKGWRRLRKQKYGGYKYAQSFSDQLWSRYLPSLFGTVVISNLQLLGRSFLDRHKGFDVVPCFYIDGTLMEYFHGYSAVEETAIGPDIVAHAIEMERLSYAQAARIFTMSQATNRVLVAEYGVAADKVRVLLPGANLADAAVPLPSQHTGWHGPEFTLGFVGLFPIRKGLDKIAGAVQILRARQVPIRLRVIGRCPDEIASIDGVDYLGTISKVNDTHRFVEAIRSVDLGCQLSRAELLGLAMLEFLRVGVPVLATNTGGMPDVIEGGGGVLVPVNVTTEQLADELHQLMFDSERYQALRNAAINRAGWASWQRTAREMDVGLQGIG